MYENELMHHGVLGMRWGVRKDRSLGGSYQRAHKSRMSEDAREAKQIKKKKVSQMSNAELKKLNTRQELERKYSQMNPSVIQKGMKFVAATAGTMGTVVALKNNGSQVIAMGKKFIGK